MAYDPEFKKAILEKLAQPGQSIVKLAKEEGIARKTLSTWKKEMQQYPHRIPQKERFSSQEKFFIILETASMTEEELTDYARRKGIYLAELKTWKENCINANSQNTPNLKALCDELKASKQKTAELARELDHKTKALAEAAALLVLRKKAHAIWGDSEDE